MTRFASLALALLGLALVGPARAENASACAAVSDPMAYNACLARHGPQARSIGAPRGASAHGAPAAARAEWRARRRRGGRAHAEFRVGR